MLHLKYDNARWVGSEDLETWMPIVNPELIGDTKKLSFIADKGDPLYEWPGTWGCGKRIVNLGAHIVEHEDAAKLIAPQQPQAEKTDNELIAEFMGMTLGVCHGQLGAYKPVPSNDVMPEFISKNALELYRTSWDWLMPVVEKIATHIYESWPDSNGYKEIVHHDRAYPRTFGMIDNEGKWMVRINRMPLEQEGTLIQATYNAVVEWIKAHNTKIKQL